MAHNVAVIVGSLRKEAFSLKVAKALAKLAPASLKLNIVTLEGLSFFNQDLEANPPADWLAFRETLQKSDAVLLVTPEYNRSIPGRAEERDRHRLASLRQELVQRPADRFLRHLARRAWRRQRGQAPAADHAGHRRADHAAARGLCGHARRCIRRER